jgi:hypothetical protein
MLAGNERIYERNGELRHNTLPDEYCFQLFPSPPLEAHWKQLEADFGKIRHNPNMRRTAKMFNSIKAKFAP